MRDQGICESGRGLQLDKRRAFYSRIAMNSLRMRATRRWFALLCSIVIMLAALAPTVSRSLSPSEKSSTWVELCTTFGMQWVQIDFGNANANANASPSESDAEPQGLAGVDRCPLCVFVADLAHDVHVAAPEFVPLQAISLPLLPDSTTLPTREVRWTAPRGPPVSDSSVLLA